MPASPTSPAPTTAIIGASGSLGFGLTLRLARVGVPIVIGSRDSVRAEQTAQRALATVPTGNFAAAANAEAVARAEAVILSVPFASQAQTLTDIASALKPGQILIDATVPLATAVGGKATRMISIWQGSAAQQARELTPAGVSVVSALHTVSAALLTDLDHPLQEDVLICGDSRADKRRAAALIGRIEGLRCVDCGRLEMARTTESLTAMMIAVNVRYKTHAGIHLTGLPDGLWA